jgi:hypothetical protein
MSKWMVRGLVFAGAMVLLRLIQGAIVNTWPTMSGLASLLLLLLFAIAVGVWGGIDGRADAENEPDPDRRQDLAMTWLLAGISAGVLSGAVSWIISLFYTGIYTGGPINELTTFAAFVALLVFLPAILSVSIGRWLVDRHAPPPEKHDGSRDREGTDVFAAARGDEAPTREAPRGQHGQRTQAAPTAVAEREEPTEVIRTRHEASGHDAPTETIRTTDRDDAPTEVIRTDTEETRPHRTPRND